jgi:hypothetical protein
MKLNNLFRENYPVEMHPTTATITITSLTSNLAFKLHLVYSFQLGDMQGSIFIE